MYCSLLWLPGSKAKWTRVVTLHLAMREIWHVRCEWSSLQISPCVFSCFQLSRLWPILQWKDCLYFSIMQPLKRDDEENEICLKLLLSLFLKRLSQGESTHPGRGNFHLPNAPWLPNTNLGLCSLRDFIERKRKVFLIQLSCVWVLGNSSLRDD